MKVGSLKAWFRGWGIGAKVAGATFAMVGAVFFIFVALVTWSSARSAEDDALREVSEKTQLLADTFDVVDVNLRKEVATFARVLGNEFSAGLTRDEEAMMIVGTQSVPTLSYQGKPINLDFTVPDRFTSLTGVYATLFVRSGDEFVRISTSHKKENGERAIGTMLDHAHPAWRALLDGQTYAGPAKLFGGQYMTQYDPIKNAEGKVIGIRYVGINFTESMRSLKDKMLAIKLGDTGHFYALNSKEGPDLGKLAIAREGEGGSLLETKDADGNAVFKTMLEQKQGVLRYRVANANGPSRERLVSFRTIKAWNLLIVGESDKEEVTRNAAALQTRLAWLGLCMVIVVAGLLYPLVRAIVTRPLAYALGVVRTVAAGDLTSKIEIRAEDEIGQLMRAMRDMNASLARMVGEVRGGTDMMADASSRIAAGNGNLSSRVEQQAASLERTASAMEELTGTVRQNADNARQANQLAVSASNVAVHGGKVVSDVVTTMESINASARKIADIISVIDGIAFQTNILALNAAVEAARAGEQGRGFAVVASEVRNLAQRSAGAAREIKELINISVEKVTRGTELVANAGGTMHDIVDSVAKVTAIMGQIMAASEEQAIGIAEVNQAVGEMDAVTQQNAALVSAGAREADILEQQACALAEVVTIFRIDAVPVAAAAATYQLPPARPLAAPARRALKAA